MRSILDMLKEKGREAIEEEAFNYTVCKALDIMLELKASDDLVISMLLKHFDICYSEAIELLNEAKEYYERDEINRRSTMDDIVKHCDSCGAETVSEKKQRAEKETENADKFQHILEELEAERKERQRKWREIGIASAMSTIFGFIAANFMWRNAI